MCGIFGHVGRQNSVHLCVNGLKRLEYRGYDSAGIAGLNDAGELLLCKEVGKVHVLEESIKQKNLELRLAISHTRWATHGKPTRENAHPQLDQDNSLAVVHNGIIENHMKLREMLRSKGVCFASDTDTEVIAQLISYFYRENKDILLSLKKALKLLDGSFSLGILHKDFPDRLFAMCRETPLLAAINKKKEDAYLSSCPHALTDPYLDVVYLKNDQIAVLKENEIDLFEDSETQVSFSLEPLEVADSSITKGEYPHFMLKEIFEQPETIGKALLNRFSDEYGTAEFENLKITPQELLSTHHILILGCGTSWHAGCIAADMLQEMARIPTQAEIASEFRYKNPIVSENTLVIAISQSGETADTIAAVREVKAKGAKVLAICNVRHSTLTREADSTLFLRADPEISVCSTKLFTSQVTLLSLFALYMARLRHLSKEAGRLFLSELKTLPKVVEEVLSLSPLIQALAKKYASFEHFFYLGRRYMHSASLEGALKLKEISYVNANGYPAGEMKHGPIALISPKLAVVAMCGNRQTYDKTLSNLMEVKARGGVILAFAFIGSEGIEQIADDVLFLPMMSDPLATIPFTVAGQLFAYYIALERGTDIDHPRHLAKSVTVE